MSQENVELHYRTLDAVNRRDLGALLALMDDGVEAVPLIAAMEGGYHGHDGIRRWWANLLDAFPDFAIEIVEVRDVGDVTVMAVRIRGHGADSDTPVEQMIWHAVRWGRERCIWWGSFDTLAEALESLGLSEQDARADS